MTTIGLPLPATSAPTEFSSALSELLRIVQFRDRDRACCHDVSVSQCYALKGAVEQEGLTINELAGYLYLDKSTASRVAQGLVEKGLLERVRDRDDGRVVRVVATEAGHDVHARIERDLEAEYHEILRDFEPEILPDLIRLIHRLNRSFAGRVDTTGGSCCVVGREDSHTRG